MDNLQVLISQIVCARIVSSHPITTVLLLLLLMMLLLHRPTYYTKLNLYEFIFL